MVGSGVVVVVDVAVARPSFLLFSAGQELGGGAIAVHFGLGCGGVP